MYEKPQYFTPDGFRRVPKNPFKTGISLEEAAKRLAENKNSKNTDTLNKSEKKIDFKNIKPHVAHFLKLHQNVEIKKHPQMSDKAAQLIAEAIKSLLNNK